MNAGAGAGDSEAHFKERKRLDEMRRHLEYDEH
jgi:hypothetical protein